MPRLGLTPLVERDAELASVRLALGGGTRAVVVVGPAGVGKSRLVTSALAGTPVVRALASPWSPTPFGPVNDLLASAGRASLPPGPDHANTVRAYACALRQLPGPVVVEDLHWADAGSLATLVDLARAPDGPALVATARDEPGRVLAAALAMLSSTPEVTIVTLTGLSTSGVGAMLEALLGRPVPARVALQVRRRTDGLPLWVEELARAAGDAAALAFTPLPNLIDKALCDRVDAAGPDARRLAEATAVLGGQVRLSLLARVLDRTEESLSAALRPLVEAWVVVEQPPDRVSFRHALTREAVAARVPAAQRRRWHRRAYAALQTDRAGDAELAWCAAGAGLRAETVAAAQRAAAELLATGSGADALSLAELALDAGADPAWPVHAIAARAAYAAGWFDEAGAHADAWRDGAVAAGAAAEFAGAECLRANLCWHAGDLAGQQAALAAALSRANLPPAARARVLAARSNALLRAERPADALVESDRALAAATGAGDPVAWRGALVDKASAMCMLADRGEPGVRRDGLALLDQAEAECQAAGDLVNLGRVLNNGLAARMAGLPAAQRWAVWESAWQRASTLGIGTSLGKIVRHAVDLAYDTGHWQRGWDAVTDRLADETEPVERVVLSAKAALLALEADLIDDAARLAERSTAEATGMDQFWAILYVALVDVALTARAAGAGSGARGGDARTVRALGRYRAAVAMRDHPRKPHRATEAARWALDAGVAPASVRGFLATTLPGGPPPWLAPETELALAEAGGRHTQAVALGERLLETDLGGVRRADVLVRAGRSLLATGRLAEATRYALEACDLLAAWPGHRRRAAHALRQAVTSAGPALTARERQVSALVAEGLSNQAIGARLGISARTVAVHVSRVLAKTGCGSRTELAVRHLSVQRLPAPAEPERAGGPR